MLFSTMPGKSNEDRCAHSKADTAVDVQNDNHIIHNNVADVCGEAVAILDAWNATKKQRKSLLGTATSLL